jgi:hypothetical protein
MSFGRDLALFQRVRADRPGVHEGAGASRSGSDSNESPFKIAQGITLLLFIIFGVLAVRTYRGLLCFQLGSVECETNLRTPS